MNCTDDIIIKYIEEHFSEKRRVHTYGVVETAEKMARFYGVDMAKARTAALFHDMFRGVSVEELNSYVQELGLDEKYMNNANLAHGKIAAAIMKRDYGIEDEDILNAVSFHTTGRAGMSDLEKVVYIADAIEPNRDYPSVELLRKAAYDGLDEVCLLSMEKTIDFVKSKDMYLDEDTIHARDWLRRKINEHI